MTEQELKQTLAGNIAYYRKAMGLTQTGLSELINYSDKSVSKWERAEGVPDLFVLVELARIFGVSVSDLLSADKKKRRVTRGWRQRLLIALLSVGLVWLTASVVFFVLRLALPDFAYAQLAFVYAIPASAVVWLVFSVLWFGRFCQFLSVSVLIWTTALSLFVSLSIPNMQLIFILAAVLQVLAVLWYALLGNHQKPPAALSE
ncbi:MAG: helix-turn-helix transcriptional regulator [Eubacteriales bacterium]